MAVCRAVRTSLDATGPVVLAVSGGRDSMALLRAAAEVAPGLVACVATFDHGTGDAATAAADLVRSAAAALGFPVVAGRATRPAHGEAAWRAQRWAFLRAAARDAGGARVATAHTADDQAETVFMRALRGAGARGLAGLAAGGPVARPLLGVGRAEAADYARAREVRWIDDPTNDDRRHLRNRVRLELLPAIARLRPGFRDELLALGAAAATWRAGVEQLAGAVAAVERDGAAVAVPADLLAGLADQELAVLWPAVAALARVTLDRRGTARLARFTREGRVGGRVPLAGGAGVARTAGQFVLRRDEVDIPPSELSAQPLVASVEHGRFRFRRVRGTAPLDVASAWWAEFDAGAVLVVRAWRAGDRMRLCAGGRARRVKRFFADARVPAFDRAGWPVVEADGAIAWIPGVRRSDAATVRPGRPGVRYHCDRNHR